MPMHTQPHPRNVSPLLNRDDMRSEYDAHAALCERAHRYTQQCSDDAPDMTDAFDCEGLSIDWDY